MLSIGWYKSTFSGSDKTCVEVARRANTVLIRDSKYTGPAADQPIIEVPRTHWRQLLDLALAHTSGTLPGILTVETHHDGSTTLTVPTGTQLTYTPAEWDAFTKGVADAQFDFT